MKWCYAVCAALLVFPPTHAIAADDLNAAARELARETAAYFGRGETVPVVWRNVSSLGASELSKARSAFETALREAGARAVEATSGETIVTLSENPSQYLLVEEARKGDERQVWIASWKRTGAPRVAPALVAIEKKLLLEADEPILDAAFPGEMMVVLSASRVTWFTLQNAAWTPLQYIALPGSRGLPRDPRGHLRTSGAGLQAFLPGVNCRVSVPMPALECRASEEPWVLESGGRFLLVANFASGRNYFDGRLTTQTGAKKTIAPFYSAAAVEENGHAIWLFAMVDGEIRLFDTNFDSVGPIASWGSDLAGIAMRCGSGGTVLATRAGAALEGDSVQTFAIVNRGAVSLGPAAELPGAVTALWPSGDASAVAVVHDLQTGKYAAYLITVTCGG